MNQVGGNKFEARKVVRGKATAEAIVYRDGFSFLGDVDLATGEILSNKTANKGVPLKGKILICRETVGSSGGCIVLMTLASKGLAPAAIVTIEAADYNMTEGAILSKVPFLCCPNGDLLAKVESGQAVFVDGDLGVIQIE